MLYSRGFTLLELLVVLAVVGVVGLGISLSLRDSTEAELQRDAVRLSAWLESARSAAQAHGQPLRWKPAGNGFEFPGAWSGGTPDGAFDRLQPWLNPSVNASIVVPEGAQTLLLGPEPLLRRQAVALALGPHRLWVASDGVGPFRILAAGELP